MPSELVVPVAEIKNVRPHPNADKLELCDVLGFQMCIPKGTHKNGDRVVYFPPDTIIPHAWSEQFGCVKYLKGSNNDRVGSIKLRGEPSAGLAVPLPSWANWKLGQNVADEYDCIKYVPPVKQTAGDTAKYDSYIDPFFSKFTNIQNGRIFTDILTEGEPCIYTEKIHGSCCRVGIINGFQVAGSMEARRKQPWRYATETCLAGKIHDFLSKKPWLNNKRNIKNLKKYLLRKVPQVTYPLDSPQVSSNTYWHPWSLPGVEQMLWNLGGDNFDEPGSSDAILYGEMFGPGMQSLHYNQQKPSFAAFGLNINGKFVDWDKFTEICTRHGVTTVPVLHKGPYSLAKAKELANGNSTIADHIREGVVIYPEKERFHPVHGRAIVKIIGDDYAASKHKDAEVTEV